MKMDERKSQRNMRVQTDRIKGKSNISKRKVKPRGTN
jgi:hypothetical protein